MRLLAFVSVLTIAATTFGSGEMSSKNAEAAQNPPTQQTDVRWKRVNNRNGSTSYSISNCMVTIWKDDLTLNAWGNKGAFHWRQTVILKKGRVIQDSRIPSKNGRSIFLSPDDSGPNLFNIHCAEAAKGLPQEVRTKFQGYSGIQ